MNIILSPIITEKSMTDASHGKFTFKVAMHAHKKGIKKEIEDNFKVNVINVATMVVKGKIVRTGKKRMETKSQGYKKAIVALKKGQKIDLFEVGGQQGK
ncbi:MAG: 50S ribosomal protein L23 [Candidatus Levybacteria bacterium RBG_16_35_6]|nr:MAG: 50S ribosomal protein L23 [Candidatus Levybacteria bacterium RBG_16_35_6]